MSHLYLIKGTQSSYAIVVARSGDVVNLTGCSLVFEARRTPSTEPPVIRKTIGSGLVITDAVNGAATLTISAADTASLGPEFAFLYYRLILDDGTGPEDVDNGNLQITVDSTPFLYITVEDVRALGLDAATFPDSAVLAAIKTWQAFLERACRQWFYPLELELYLDGTDSNTINFGVPAISISEVRLNGDSQPLNPTYYKVYNNPYISDRTNPRIKLIEQRNCNYDIFTAPLRDGQLIFRFGHQNQYIKGIFGYIEPDGSTPELIKRALSKLVVEKLAHPLYVPPDAVAPTPPPLMAGIVTEEWTDGHKIKYAQSGGDLLPRKPGLAGITDDQEILNIIKLYKAPLGVATPNNAAGR